MKLSNSAILDLYTSSNSPLEFGRAIEAHYQTQIEDLLEEAKNWAMSYVEVDTAPHPIEATLRASL